MEHKKIEVEYLAETWDGVLVRDNSKTFWLEKSCLKGFQEYIHKKNRFITIYLPKQIADKRGLV